MKISSSKGVTFDRSLAGIDISSISLPCGSAGLQGIKP